MDEQTKMRLRTAVMVVNLVALPFAAVVGIKWPQWLIPGGPPRATMAELRNRTKQTDGGVKSLDTPVAAGPRLPPSTARDLAEPGSQSGGYPVQPTTNIAVRPDDIVPLRDDPQRAPHGIPTEATAAAVPISEEQPPIAELNLNDPFSQIQHRLRALGATYFALETWGPQGDMYRFQARVAAEQNPGYSRHFEATDTDPLRVMQTVLEEVESWKSGRMP